MPVGLGETRKNVPPVIEQRDKTCSQAATREVVRGEAAPAPLVFQLVENIFRIAAISVQLVNAGELLQRLAGAKVQQGCKQKGPRYRGPFCLSRLF